MAHKWIPGEEVTAAKLNQTGEGLDIGTMTYDVQGRLSSFIDSDSGFTYTLTYDTDDKLLTIANGTNTWTMTYNSDGNITAVTKT